MEFENKSFWKFTTALGRKLSDGRLFFTKLFLTVYDNNACESSEVLLMAYGLSGLSG